MYCTSSHIWSYISLTTNGKLYFPMREVWHIQILTKGSNLILPIMEQTGIIYFLIQCSEKDTISYNIFVKNAESESRFNGKDKLKLKDFL